MVRGLRQLLAALCLAGVLSGSDAGLGPSAPELSHEAVRLAIQREEFEREAPKTVLQLQMFRSESQVPLASETGAMGSATLVNLNPAVSVWYLLTITGAGPGAVSTSYHLESIGGRPLQLIEGDANHLRLAGLPMAGCVLWSRGGPNVLAEAAGSALPYAPLCAGALYLRNRVGGHRSMLERVTDFLRDHVWEGDEIVTFVKREFYRDAFAQQGQVAHGCAAPAVRGLPRSADVSGPAQERCTRPSAFGLDVEAPGESFAPGQWYAVRDVPGAYASLLAPEDVSSGILRRPERSVNALDGSELRALVYLVAFDLQRFTLRFALGSEHPRVDWSPRPPPSMRDPRLPGPDGIGTIAPLVGNGLVSPSDIDRTVATFAGGFKREHGAFRVGALALRNHGSHYGFMQQGVVLSKLQPGLATLLMYTDGHVEMRTWSAAQDASLGLLRDARQNGVPLLEYDPGRGEGVAGSLVNQWGPGNWSGSAEEVLRTVRAGVCVQHSPEGDFLLFGYFSSATPSAMARVFEAYHCSYAMHLDMNALEHTYFALYVHRGHQRILEHLVEGMEQLDEKTAGTLAPRFLAFPDNRDFFAVERREIP